MSPRLFRKESNKKLSGVCSGLAEYLAIDVVVVRIAFIALVLASGIGIPLYIVLAIIMPAEEELLLRIDLESTEKKLKSAESRRKNILFISVLFLIAGVFLMFGHGMGSSIWGAFLLIALGGWLWLRSRKEDANPF